MPADRNLPFGISALAIICVAGFGVGIIASQSSSERRSGAAELNVTTITTTYDLDTQYVGKCGIVTPPTPDACDAAQGTLRYFFFAALAIAPT